MRRRHLPLGSGLPPLSVRISDACRMTGIGRSKLYELIKDGAVEVIKVGAITLVPMSSIQALLHRGHRGTGAATHHRLAGAPHPLLTNAILTSTLAGTSEEVRRNLCSTDMQLRTMAENGLAARMVAALYELSGESR